MFSFSDPAGRRLLTGLYGSLIFVVVDIVLYLMRAPGYQALFCIFIIYVMWVYVRFLKERKQPVDYVPWYTSQPKVFFVLALVNILLGVWGLLKNTGGYRFIFLVAIMFFILSVVLLYKEKRDQHLPTDQE
jgi:uncharacterized sodium:solute symporter family permease YidK